MFGTLALLAFLVAPAIASAAVKTPSVRCPAQTTVNDGVYEICNTTKVTHQETGILLVNKSLPAFNAIPRQDRAVFVVSNADVKLVILTAGQTKTLTSKLNGRQLQITYQGRINRNSYRMGFQIVPLPAPVAITAAKNIAFPDASVSNPTGIVGQTNVKVTSLVITANDSNIEQVVIDALSLADNNPPLSCAGQYIENLYFMDEAGNRLGLQPYPITLPDHCPSDGGRYSYGFRLNESPTTADTIILEPGQSFVVNVFADLVQSMPGPISLMKINTVEAHGRVSGQDATISDASIPLQAQYIAAYVVVEAGNLAVGVDPSTPSANNYLMGATDQTVAKFRFTADAAETINVEQLVVSFRLSQGATGTIKNIRLVNDATGDSIGSAVASLTDFVNGVYSPIYNYSHADFNLLPLQVPQNSSVVIAVKADFTGFEEGGFDITGFTLTPGLLESYSDSEPKSSVTAIGAGSGQSITPIIGGSTGSGSRPGAFASQLTLYRAKLLANWNVDTPMGAVPKSSEQLIAKFTISNLPNVGNYVATVRAINIDLSSNIQNTRPHRLRIYKDSASGSPLADVVLNGEGTWNFSDVSIADANFEDVYISSGAFKTFYVTLDTTDARVHDALGVRLGVGDIFWSDGVVSTDLMGGSLPLSYRTMVY